MPTRAQVLTALGGGANYEAVAVKLGISPGLAYLIATGRPADGSDSVTADEAAVPGAVHGSTQQLANPSVHKPDAGEVVSAWLRQRAASDLQMTQAAKSRTATPAPVEDPEDVTDVLTVLVRQHDQVVSLVKQLDTIPGRSKGGNPVQASERESIVDMISKRLAEHETAEEEHLWPAIRRALPTGDEWAEHGLQQEQEATETLASLAKADPQSAEFDDLVETLMSQLHKHVALEDRIFQQLRDALNDDERRSLGKKVLAAQRHAPTRPHPHAPRGPGAAVAAAAKSAVPLDKARDMTGRPADREGRPDPDVAQPASHPSSDEND